VPPVSDARNRGYNDQDLLINVYVHTSYNAGSAWSFKNVMKGLL
jgi:hypothetical protein